MFTYLWGGLEYKWEKSKQFFGSHEYLSTSTLVIKKGIPYIYNLFKTITQFIHKGYVREIELFTKMEEAIWIQWTE